MTAPPPLREAYPRSELRRSSHRDTGLRTFLLWERAGGGVTRNILLRTGGAPANSVRVRKGYRTGERIKSKVNPPETFCTD
jgi:hypothetical protein